MLVLSSLLALASCQAAVAATAGDVPPTAYTAPGVFPTSAFGSYWNNPTATSAQPQPVISDPVTVCTIYAVLLRCSDSFPKNTVFPENLTDPVNFPKVCTITL